MLEAVIIDTTRHDTTRHDTTRPLYFVKTSDLLNITPPYKK